MPIDNFGIASTYNGRKLYRSAQPDSLGLADLFSMGVGTIIKLNEGDDVGYQGIDIHAPLAGWALWYSSSAIVSICHLIRSTLESQDCLVHCTHGRDRTGLVCAAYCMLYDGKSLDEVNADRAAYGVTGVIALVDAPENGVLKEIASGNYKP